MYPHRNTDLFAYMALNKGKVLVVNEHGIQIQYEDGNKVGIELGLRFGNAAGLAIPHTVVSPLKTGDVFEKGAPIAYNTGFYEPDFFNPKQIVLKSSLLLLTAFLENNLTLEDSSTLSVEATKRLTTKLAKTREVVIGFNQKLSRCSKVGDHVDAQDPLCIIEDAITADKGLFNEASLDTLKIMSNHAPAAKFTGEVSKMEVFYNGDIEEMSESLQTLVIQHDRRLSAKFKTLGKPVLTGEVNDGSLRVDGTPLEANTVCIRFYLTHDTAMSVGDKGVIANQMKTVTGAIMPYSIETEDGQRVDATMGAKSVADRIVSSAYLIGCATTTLIGIGKGAVALYRKHQKH